MQAMNFQSVQPSMPNTAMPFMAAQVDAQKQVTFSSPLNHTVEKMADKLVLDAAVIKCAIIIRDLRIEVTLMAEETQEEILHVLMIVYSPCRTP